VNGVQSRPPGSRVTGVLKFLGIEDFTFQTQAMIFGVLAAIVLISKTLLSIYFVRKTMFYMSRKGAAISGELIRKLLSTNLFVIQSRSSQDSLYAMNEGVTSLTMGFITVLVAIVSDASLLLILIVGLFVIDPTIAFSTVFIFANIGLFLYFFQQRRAKNLGRSYSQLNIQVSEETIEALSTYRELLVRGIRDEYAKKISKLQSRIAGNQAEITFMPLVSKYVVEVSVVISALLICGIQFLITDASHAVATLSVFLAAGTRIAPAVLRIQQGAISIRGNLAASKSTLDMLDSIRMIKLGEKSRAPMSSQIGKFNPMVELQNLEVIYPGSLEPAISNCNLKIYAGQIVAIVGPSGAGKTTLVDALLGVVPVTSGRVLISGLNPLEAIENWPGSISYVPQEVSLSSSTIRENVQLGFKAEFPEVNMNHALSKSQLSEFISKLPLGIETQVGERGSKLSGGQRQRLGIARALYTEPKLLILDEATSALDSETERLLSDSIKDLKSQATIIMIAHRLSTVRNSDIVIYMEKGKIVATGSMNEVRQAVPNFDIQARLMGI
jgi:ABC-type multidrug transport system fused ATPase/permease subunit